MKSSIKVMLKEGVLDPQGTTVNHALDSLGYNQVSNVRIGKHIDMVLDTNDKDEADRLTKEICEKLLANLVIESYEYKLED